MLGSHKKQMELTRKYNPSSDATLNKYRAQSTSAVIVITQTVKSTTGSHLRNANPAFIFWSHQIPPNKTQQLSLDTPWSPGKSNLLRDQGTGVDIRRSQFRSSWSWSRARIKEETSWRRRSHLLRVEVGHLHNRAAASPACTAKPQRGFRPVQERGSGGGNFGSQEMLGEGSGEEEPDSCLNISGRSGAHFRPNITHIQPSLGIRLGFDCLGKL